MTKTIAVTIAFLALTACGGRHHPHPPGAPPVLFGWDAARGGYVELRPGDTAYGQILIGFPTPFSGVRLDVARTDGIHVTLYGAYSRGADDAAVPLTDGTGALTYDGEIRWTPPADWQPGLSWSSTLLKGLYVVRIVLEEPVGAQPPAVTIYDATAID